MDGWMDGWMDAWIWGTSKKGKEAGHVFRLTFIYPSIHTSPPLFLCCPPSMVSDENGCSGAAPPCSPSALCSGTPPCKARRSGVCHVHTQTHAHRHSNINTQSASTFTRPSSCSPLYMHACPHTARKRNTHTHVLCCPVPPASGELSEVKGPKDTCRKEGPQSLVCFP